ncbi:hypothetical protein [Parvularcula sp. LCG005]|uniref:hypothetical protein n=1 Tax=Parvularcula sp. LCG005 TaxID=3078805 RepID=UPI002942C7D0|nr:hypothetical protein [Parvularcula sp. LCG005]WOI53815.1 hypothetical protein RUI03_02165 [Parvularcula sp. LCG005]
MNKPLKDSVAFQKWMIRFAVIEFLALASFIGFCLFSDQGIRVLVGGVVVISAVSVIVLFRKMEAFHKSNSKAD